MRGTSKELIGVVGAGAMGCGIAELSARSGLEVILFDHDPSQLSSGRSMINASLSRQVARGELDSETSRDAFAKLTACERLEGLGDCTFVFEAISEDESDKVNLFRDLEKLVIGNDAIIASNTSSIPITRLAASLDVPGRFLGVHFFNPVTVLPLVEVTPAIMTTEGTKKRVLNLVSQVLGKTVIFSPDQPGFVVNRLLIPFILSAIRMVEQCQIAPEVIDLGMEKGCAHPMGPLRLADLIGLDIVHLAAQAMYREYLEPAYVPPTLLLRKIEARQLGRKTGHGFYTYES